MKLAVIEGREVAPCVGSGYCCKTTMCWEGRAVHGDMEGICPSLRGKNWKGLTVYRCGLYEDATGEEKVRIELSLSIGAGCCSNLNSDRISILRQLRSSSSSPFSTSSFEESAPT